MRRLPIKLSPFVALAFLLSLPITTGCADDALAPATAEEPAAQQANPHAVLSGSELSDATGTAVEGELKGRPSATSIATFGFIQGLATAPNGDILVADLTAGIFSSDGDLGVELPGVTDLSPIGRSSMWATVGPDDGATTFEDRGQALYRASNGRSRLIANLFAFEEEHNPDGLGIDSNPYDVYSLGGRSALVVDAAGNDLLRVDNQGNVEVVAVFPQGDPDPTSGIRPEAVPTSVAVGPDGYYYVGELTGFPATPGASSIWRIAPDASGATCGEPSSACQKAFDGGFTSIIDLEFDADGTLYVAEFDEQSWLAAPSSEGGTINACELSSPLCDNEVATGIPFLTAITFGNDGALWATSGFATTIEVIPQ